MKFLITSLVLLLNLFVFSPLELSLALEIELAQKGENLGNVPENDVTIHGDSLQGIEPKTVSNSFHQINGENNNQSSKLDLQVERQKENDNNNDFFDTLAPEKSDDFQDRLNSNRGDVPTSGSKINLFDF